MAGLPTQTVPIPLAQGVDTKTDPKQVPLGKLLTLENGFFQTPLEIRKIPGFTALGTHAYNQSFALGSNNGLFNYKDELIAYVPSNSTATYAPALYSYLDGINQWSEIGYFQSSKLTVNEIASGAPGTTQTYQDSAYDPVNGFYVYTYNAGSYVVVDAATKKVFNSGTIGSVSRAKPVYFGGSILIITISSAGIIARRTVSALGQVSSGTTINSNADTTHRNFDLAVVNARLFIAFNAIVSGVSILYLDSSYVVSSVTADTTAPAQGCIAVCGDVDLSKIYVAFSNNVNVYYKMYDYNLTSLMTSTVLAAARANIDQISLVSQTAGTAVAIQCVFTSDSINNVIYASLLSLASPAAGGVIQRSACIASKLFLYNSNMYFLGQYADVDTGQPTLFLFLLPAYTSTIATVVGKICPATAYILARSNFLPEVLTVSAGHFEIAFSRTFGVAEFGQSISTWALNVDLSVTPMGAEIANGLHLSGGQLWLYDGSTITEHNFHLYPEIISATQSGTGVLTANASYEYVCTYEWLDAQGVVHRSATSLPFSITTGGSGAASVAVVVSTLRITNKANVRIGLYRTAGNGTVLYLDQIGTNDTAADTVTFTDVGADSGLITSLELYTTGGQVDNSSAPPNLAIATYKSRLVVIPSDDPYSWWFSQEVIPNSASSSATPVELSDFLIQNIDQAGGPLTGILQMDDKLILMKQNQPYYIVGNGPAPNGTNNDYSTPQSIVAPVGLVSGGVPVLMPLGIMFPAANSSGLWLLDRGLNVSFIGSDVATYNSQTVTSAVLYGLYNQVRFSMSGGVILAFDYFMRQWTVMTGITVTQACLFEGAYTYGLSTGTVLQEDASVYTNNGSFVQLKVGTSWMKFAGLQGFQRIYEALILGDYESAHTLNAAVYYDFNTVAEQTTAITPTSTLPYQWRLLFKRQKCQAMKIELYDTQVSPAEGLRLSALSLIVGVKAGLNKMPAARTFD